MIKYRQMLTSTFKNDDSSKYLGINETCTNNDNNLVSRGKNYCHNCGRELSNNDTFCPNCSTPKVN